MNKIYSIVTGILLTASVLAQAPQKMSYQAVIRNSSNALVTSTKVGMRISILKGSATATASPLTDYVETQKPTTNANGLVSLEIGTGTAVTGTFATINWANGPYFIKTETDPTGGTNYTIIGSNELLSVPYALYSANSTPGPKGDKGETGFQGLKGDQGIQGVVGVPGPKGDKGETGTFQNGTAAGQMNYWNGSAWATVPPGVKGQTLTFCDGVPTWGPCPASFPQGMVHCTNPPTAIVPVTNPTTSKIWMDRNLGATQVATSSTDAASYGDLYQWGRGADGHQCRTSVTTATLSTSDVPGNANFILASSSPNDWRSAQNTNLWQGVNGVNNPCPSGYRIPTNAELDAERASWSSQNSIGAFASPFKFPLAGDRFDNGSLNFVGVGGAYWTSTISGTNSRNLAFYTIFATMLDTTGRAYGLSVRCIKD
jgi:uncharacterized protein (TIGR02145 family)